MRNWILLTADSLLPEYEEGWPETATVSLDEIAATGGMTRDQVRAYYTSVAAILADLGRWSSVDLGECASDRRLVTAKA